MLMILLKNMLCRQIILCEFASRFGFCFGENNIFLDFRETCIFFAVLCPVFILHNILILSIGTDRSERIAVFDQGLHCLLPFLQFLDTSKGGKMDGQIL